MKLYVFVSTAQANIASLTPDETGGNLPADSYWEWEPSDSTPLDNAPTPIADQIMEGGYALVLAPGVKPIVSREGCRNAPSAPSTRISWRR
jgi:hypothetical protein